jgi:hypothetical protein
VFTSPAFRTEALICDAFRTDVFIKDEFISETLAILEIKKLVFVR